MKQVMLQIISFIVSSEEEMKLKIEEYSHKDFYVASVSKKSNSSDIRIQFLHESCFVYGPVKPEPFIDLSLETVNFMNF